MKKIPIDETVTKRYCDGCEQLVSLDDWTIDEHRCDACVWDAWATEAYGEALAYMEGNNIENIN